MMGEEKWKESDALVESMHSMKRLHWNSLLRDVSNHEFGFLMMILRFQKRNPEVKGIYVSDLAKKLCITKSAVSRMLGNLEKWGLVERAVDPNNRRNTFVYLTEKGSTLCREQNERMRAFLHQVETELGEQRYQEILTGMQELSAAMARVMTAWEQNSQSKEETKCDQFCDT
ncbi:MAG: MarR family transcriptional regulator [Eubacteriales bacterium]|nr:MarR family transcriptional regulator [Eubacteriales bacterium]